MGTAFGIICGSWDILWTYSSFGFGFSYKDKQGSKIETVCKIHVAYNIDSIWLQRWKLHSKDSKTEVFVLLAAKVIAELRRTSNAELYNHVVSIPYFFRHGAKCQKQMLHATRWPQTSAIARHFCLIYLQNWLRYRYSKFQVCLLRSAIIF